MPTIKTKDGVEIFSTKPESSLNGTAAATESASSTQET